MSSQVNGEAPSNSATLSHITSYPVVSDALSQFKANPYGAKSLELGNSAYQTFAAPIVPYFAKPYEYVSPYVKKADEVGDSTLSKIDDRVPSLKKPSGDLYNDGKSLVFFPYRKSVQTKDHIFDIYNSEYKKVGGDSIITYGKAAISTGLVVTSETLTWLGDFLRTTKTKAKETGHDMQQQMQQ